jgi:hypothetical protein
VFTDSATEDDSNRKQPAAAEWTDDTQIGLSPRNTFMLSGSTGQVQQVFQAAVKLMEKYVVFTDAYPDRNPHCKLPWARGLLIQAAADVGHETINTRLRYDAGYAKIIADAVSFS